MKKPKENKGGINRPLVKEVDFYIENGNYVFTAHYLKERGYCCENGCRHCPYGGAEVKKG